MIPTASEILATVKAVSEAIKAGFEWAMTEEGKAVTKKATEDRAAWDKFWVDFGNGAKKLFTGELFK